MNDEDERAPNHLRLGVLSLARAGEADDFTPGAISRPAATNHYRSALMHFREAERERVDAEDREVAAHA